LPGNSAYSATKWALEAFGEALAMEVAGFGIDVTLAEPGPVGSGALDDVLAYSLPDDPDKAVFAQGAIPEITMISPEQVAATLAVLVERPTVPLRVPIGPVAEHVIAARNAAPTTSPSSA
jgi:NAD(P)-dependent dehydrogenase (short-subunit alcohol dehydrogenase family)